MSAFVRPQAAVLHARLLEPRARMQVLAGPRQVGKSTLVRQVLDSLGLPHHYASADAPARGLGGGPGAISLEEALTQPAAAWL